MSIQKISKGVPKPKGWFKKRCPYCGHILNVKRDPEELRIPFWVNRTYYECPCGYRFIKENWESIGST